MELVNKVKLAAKAQGLVFVHINNAHCKAMAGKTPAQLKAAGAREPEKVQAKWNFRASAKKVLDSFSSGAPTQAAFCGLSIPLTYKRKLLLKEAQLWRTDSAIVLAYQLREGFKAECVGVAAFGAADKSEFHADFHDAHIQAAVEHDSLLELDLICVRPNSAKGTGSTLMLYVLAKELARTKRSLPLYDGVLLNLAQDFQGRMPLQNIAQRMGFVQANIDPDDEGDYNYRILLSDQEDVREKLLKALPDLSKLLEVCPVKPKSGLAYCV
jgi:hypothetical protein